MEKPTNETKKQRWSKTKIRKLTFILMTCVFVVAAILLFACECKFLGKGSDFLSQLFVGFGTGSFVVACQEIVKEEQDKLDEKDQKKEHGGENGQG